MKIEVWHLKKRRFMKIIEIKFSDDGEVVKVLASIEEDDGVQEYDFRGEDLNEISINLKNQVLS